MTKVTIKDVEARMDRLEGLLEKLIQAQTKTRVSETPSNKKDKKVNTTTKKFSNGYPMTNKDFAMPWATPEKHGKIWYLCTTTYIREKDVFPALRSIIEGLKLVGGVESYKSDFVNNGKWEAGKGIAFKSKQAAQIFAEQFAIISADRRNKVRASW